MDNEAPPPEKVTVAEIDVPPKRRRIALGLSGRGMLSEIGIQSLLHDAQVQDALALASLAGSESIQIDGGRVARGRYESTVSRRKLREDQTPRAMLHTGKLDDSAIPFGLTQAQHDWNLEVERKKREKATRIASLQSEAISKDTSF